MTLSLLARDPESGAIGGVAATGNLCVGGWVLRGDPRGGITASQGRTPSVLWGEDALGSLVAGHAPEDTVARLVSADGGQGHRQLALLDRSGNLAVHHGQDNHPFTGHRAGTGWICAGNWLTGPEVIDAAGTAFESTGGSFPERLLTALEAGVAAGSDRRGTLSAAMLVVAVDRPPLTLRIDHDEDPVTALSALHRMTLTPAYQGWLDTVPTRNDPERTA